MPKLVVEDIEFKYITNDELLSLLEFTLDEALQNDDEVDITLKGFSENTLIKVRQITKVEKEFADWMLRFCNRDYVEFDSSIDPKTIMEETDCNVPKKYCEYFLEKWNAMGWYEYGVCLYLGWLTEAGVKGLINLLKGSAVS